MSRNTTALSLNEVLSAIGQDPTSVVLDFVVGGRTYWGSRYQHVERSIARLGASRLSPSGHCITISREVNFDGFPARWKAIRGDFINVLDDTLGEVSENGRVELADDHPVFQFLARRRCCVECMVADSLDALHVRPMDWCSHRRCHELSRDPDGDFLNNRLGSEDPNSRIHRHVSELLHCPGASKWVGGVVPRVWSVHMQRNWRDRFDNVIGHLSEACGRYYFAGGRRKPVANRLTRRFCSQCNEEWCSSKECLALKRTSKETLGKIWLQQMLQACIERCGEGEG